MAWIVLLLVVVPLVELWFIIQVAQVIGGWETIALVIVESVIGGWLVKRQGLATLAAISRAVDQARVPAKELVDGFLIIVAGSLMLAPGFLTDLVAFLLLIPPTRALVRAPLMKRFAAGTHGRFFTSMGSAAGGRFIGTFRAGSVYDASGHEADGVDRRRLDP
ncbi:MAG TPA: FxsA family protein [Aquihabitans sp.]|jgi:UPF0716 protein FxsA|nr:FxsA family protein [Aquihabitans sp.]